MRLDSNCEFESSLSLIQSKRIVLEKNFWNIKSFSVFVKYTSKKLEYKRIVTGKSVSNSIMELEELHCFDEFQDGEEEDKATILFLTAIQELTDNGLWLDKESLFRISQMEAFDEDILMGEFFDQGYDIDEFVGFIATDPQMEQPHTVEQEDHVQETSFVRVSSRSGDVKDRILVGLYLGVMAMLQFIRPNGHLETGNSRVAMATREHTTKMEIDHNGHKIILVKNNHTGVTLLLYEKRNWYPGRVYDVAHTIRKKIKEKHGVLVEWITDGNPGSTMDKIHVSQDWHSWDQ